MAYRPEALVLTLSRQCNLQCGHCIVEASPFAKEKLDLSIAEWHMRQVHSNGINRTIIYGGEPFLHPKELFDMVKLSLSYGLNTSIATNGFWGRSESRAGQTLRSLGEIAEDYEGIVYVGLSVDKYHQPAVPLESIVNIISQFRQGDFTSLLMGIQTFKEEESWTVLGDVYRKCHQKGLYLVESNRGLYIYPALKKELIDYSPQNFAHIASRLSLPVDSAPEALLDVLQTRVKQTPERVSRPTVITRRFDIGEGVKNYTIFPDERYLINLTVEDRVVNAGRARKSGKLELELGYEDAPDYLVIAPNGQAYSHPAQITAMEGISGIKDKFLFEVIQEVGHLLESL